MLHTFTQGRHYAFGFPFRSNLGDYDIISRTKTLRTGLICPWSFDVPSFVQVWDIRPSSKWFLEELVSTQHDNVGEALRKWPQIWHDDVTMSGRIMVVFWPFYVDWNLWNAHLNNRCRIPDCVLMLSGMHRSNVGLLLVTICIAMEDTVWIGASVIVHIHSINLL